MSNCESPFEYVASSVEISTYYTTTYYGSYNLPAYYTPSTEICLLGSNPASLCNCHSCGWHNWGTCCSWCKESWYWYDCSSSPGVKLWPSITFDASCTAYLTFENSVAVVITLDTPPEPIATTSVTITNLPITININNSPLTLNLALVPISLNLESTGSFSTSIDLGSFSSKITEDGIGYTFLIEASFLFCAEPEEPLGWMNVELDCTMEADYLGVTYSSSFDITCPVTGIE